MQNLTLHIGRHKSGTSTIQSVLASNAQFLLEHGYYYPSFGRRGKAHHLLSEPLARGQLQGKNHEDIWEGLYRQLMSELDSVDEELIISSEAFQNCDPRVVRSAFEKFDCRVIVYLREQCSYLLSAYSQKVQATGYSETIEEFYENSFRIDYEKFLKQWFEQFEGNVEIRIFDRALLTGGDVVVDFFSEVLGIPVEDIQKIYSDSDSNPSLSPRMLAYKRMLNRIAPLPDAIRLDVYKVLGGMSKGDGSGSLVLPASLAERVTTEHQDSNLRIAKTYFGRDSLFDAKDRKMGASYELEDGEFESISAKVVSHLPVASAHFEPFLGHKAA